MTTNSSCFSPYSTVSDLCLLLHAWRLLAAVTPPLQLPFLVPFFLLFFLSESLLLLSIL